MKRRMRMREMRGMRKRRMKTTEVKEKVRKR